MDSRTIRGGALLEAIDGGHLHWSDFRENVLRAFRISCTASPTAGEFPEPFLAQLHAAQKNVSKHDAQRQAWRLDVSAGRGLTSLAVFPRNIVPPQDESSPTLRCMLPRLSREGLPLRLPNSKNPLYELPTAKPICVFGFNMETFSKPEQAHLIGALQVSGVSVDFRKGEVSSCRTLCCPYLAFERFTSNNKRQIETARNSCAVTGAQCLRGQQNLFHKAFGLQTVSQPPITFTCALNNQQAIINYHSVGEDGEYNMAALCKFDLEDDEHYNTFQAWIEAIDSWATLHLLPRIQSAISEVTHSNPTPPPSPTPSNSSTVLSIDTKSSDVLPILSELRRLCPTIPWRNDTMTVDTPINSSIAQCGTPLPTREIRSLSLLRPYGSSSPPLTDDSSESSGDSFTSSSRMSDMLSPVGANPSLSARRRPRTLAQHRLMFSPGLRTSFSDDSGICMPISPCRPATLSPCTPGPDMPMSNMNPILVLQRRLDVAVGEIQELRGQVDDLQAQLNSRTDMLEQKLRSLSNRLEGPKKSTRLNLSSLNCSGASVRNLDDALEQEMKTPMPRDTLSSQRSYPSIDTTTDKISPGMPGGYHRPDDEEDLMLWTIWSLITEEFTIWCLAQIVEDGNVQLGLLTSLTLALTVCCDGIMSLREFCANVMFVLVVDGFARTILQRWAIFLRSVQCAATAMNVLNTEKEIEIKPGLGLELEPEDQSFICESSIIFEDIIIDEQVDMQVDTTTEHSVTEYIPVVLC